MAQVIEFPNTPWSTQSVSLDGQNFILEFQWLNRQDNWYLSIKDIDGNLIVSNIRLVPWISLLEPIRNSTMPLGDFVLYDAQTDIFFGSDYPNYNDLRSRYVLKYFSQDEISE